jgi:hypothetical protein
MEKLIEDQSAISATVAEIRDVLPMQSSVPYISTPQLYQLLGVNEMIALQDLENVLKESSTINSTSRSQSYSLIQSEQFQNWLSGQRSALLLVDMNGVPDALERISATSVLCATLLCSLANAARMAISIHFFCGLHTAPNDPLLHTALNNPLSGPTGLVRSLIVQVLRYQDFDLRFINSWRYYEALRHNDLSSLCETLQSLVRQIRGLAVIFCVVDGISFYENEAWLEDLSYILQKLSELTHENYGSYHYPIFKLLITGAHTRRRIHWQVAPESLFEILEDFSGSQEEFVEREIIFELDTEIKQLSCLQQDASVPCLADFDDGEVDYDDERLRFGDI